MCKRRGFTSLAGFTLIELLVAITIFSVLIVAISGTLASGLRAWKLVESLDATQRKSLLTLEKVSRELRQTVIYNRIGFTGTAHSFSFCRAENNDGLFKTKYTFVDDALYVSSQDALSFVEEKEACEPTKVLGPIEAFSVQYLKFDEEQEEFTWIDAWMEDWGIPKAVQCEITTSKGKSFARTILIPVTW